jgi:hypothetical protein
MCRSKVYRWISDVKGERTDLETISSPGGNRDEGLSDVGSKTIPIYQRARLHSLLGSQLQLSVVTFVVCLGQNVAISDGITQVNSY